MKVRAMGEEEPSEGEGSRGPGEGALRPRLGAALSLDPWAARLLVGSLCLLAVGLLFRLVGYSSLAHIKCFYILAGGGIGLLLLGGRLLFLRRVFARGVVRIGRIEEARYDGGHRLRLRYEHDGEERQSSLLLPLPRRHPRARGLVAGAEIRLVVDLSRPRRAYWAALSEPPP